jgi:hypothetical protein
MNIRHVYFLAVGILLYSGICNAKVLFKIDEDAPKSMQIKLNKDEGICSAGKKPKCLDKEILIRPRYETQAGIEGEQEWNKPTRARALAISKLNAPTVNPQKEPSQVKTTKSAEVQTMEPGYFNFDKIGAFKEFTFIRWEEIDNPTARPTHCMAVVSPSVKKFDPSKVEAVMVFSKGCKLNISYGPEENNLWNSVTTIKKVDNPVSPQFEGWVYAQECGINAKKECTDISSPNERRKIGSLSPIKDIKNGEETYYYYKEK